MKKQIEEIKDCIDSVYGCDCAYFGVDGLAIAAAIYNAGYRKQEWISVEERLPEREGKYLGYTIKGTIAICNYQSYFITKEGALSKPQFDYWVTHWMPLPEPPKGE